MPLPKRAREQADALTNGQEVVDEAPKPSAVDAAAGIEAARSLAARYLPDATKLLAAIAFGKSTPKVHTRMVAAGYLIRVAEGTSEEMPEMGGMG